ELNSADGSAESANMPGLPLSRQQRAWLLLAQPITLAGGFALLSAPSSFARDAIERVLRQPIADALERHLGEPVEIAVRIVPAEDGEQHDSDAPAAPAPAEGSDGMWAGSPYDARPDETPQQRRERLGLSEDAEADLIAEE